MGIGIFFGLFTLVFLGIWIWGLIDSLARPDAAWEAAGQNKILWVVIIVFLGFIGSIVYFAVARPQLERAAGGA